MCQLNKILSFDELRLIYLVFTQSRLLSGIVVWGGAYKSNIEHLHITHKSFIKAMLNESPWFSSEQVFKESNLLSIIFSRLYNNIPLYLKNFTYVSKLKYKKLA